MNRRPFLLLIAPFALMGLTAAACGSDEPSTSATAAAAAADELRIEGAWARTSPAMVTAGAAYVAMTSPIDDALTGASVDPSIAGTVELHETVAADMGEAGTAMDTSMSGGTAEPAMEMRPVSAIDLPAGQTVTLAPGGLHIMMLDLVAPLELGQTFTMTLTFEQAGSRDVSVTVRDAAP